MMKKYFYLLILTLFSFSGFAQQRITIRLEERPMRELLEAVGKQTGLRFYCTSEVSDSLKVTVDETNAEPLALIQKALQNTDFQISVFQDAVYIIRERSLVTTLPESFYRRTPAV